MFAREGLSSPLTALIAVTLLVNAVNGRIGMTATVLTKNNFDAFVKQNKHVLVDFYDMDSRNDKELEAALRSVRNMGSMVPFCKVDASAEKELVDRFVPGGVMPQLMWFLHGEPTQYHRTIRESSSISDFVMALDRDPILRVTTEKDLTQFSRMVYAQIHRDSPFNKVMEVVARKHMDTVAFGVQTTKKDENISWVEEAKGWHEPHQYTGKADVDSFEKWVRLQLVKSEPIPEEQDGDSLTVVGQNFEEMVLRPDKDVFLMVYAPWCGFSRKFLKTWESFARQMVNVGHLVLAKMDGDSNTPPVEGFRWTAFPTVFHVKAGQREPHIFKGNRTIANLVEFANKWGSKQIAAGTATDMDELAEL
eukprot:TRINITY_DN20205_c0_g1_i1.p1 TRINITY_DN20205_c0_g1~~TRINITY_DN20205_c0_g1_i1.p1  ORF type:complete len:363 (+),score=76.26 TRINITY_DN20205_c0_g1_i1:202-1290(+)